MSGFLILITALLYISIAVSYVIETKYGLALAFLCYGIANYGLYLAGK